MIRISGRTVVGNTNAPPVYQPVTWHLDLLLYIAECFGVLFAVIFRMLGRFLMQAGHTERAIAMYQAMIELNIFCPDVLKESSNKVQ